MHALRPAHLQRSSTYAVKALTFVDYDNLTPEQKALVDKSVALNEAAGTKPKVRYIASHMDIAGRQEKMF